MKKLAAFLVAFLLAAVPALAQYTPPASGGPYQGSTVAPSTSGNVMTSNGSAWTSAAASGGGSSPFAPAGFANVSTFSDWSDLVVSPAGDYVYVGGKLASNSHGAIAKVKITDGTTVASVDLGASVKPFALAISPDGASIYALDGNGPGNTTWWKVATSAMTLTHTSTLAVSQVDNVRQQFDLSPDGTVFAYVSGVDAKLYMINTATYAVTNQTMSHTAGNLTSVCFYNGSNTNVYVAHAGSGDVDLYAIGGAYTSTVSTGAGGTPTFSAMRSGLENGDFYIADSGTNKSVIDVHSGTPHIFSLSSAPVAIAVTGTAFGDQAFGNVCGVITNSATNMVYAAVYYGLFPLQVPLMLNNKAGAEPPSGLVFTPDASGNLLVLTGGAIPLVYSVNTNNAYLLPGAAGNAQTSDGLGNWTSAAPYFTSADQTITTAGALTIAHGLTYTPGSVWFALVNQSTEAGYTAGQVVFIGGSQTVSVVAVQNDGFSAIVDATNLTIRYGSDASTFTIPNATTGAATAITNSKWKCRFFAR